MTSYVTSQVAYPSYGVPASYATTHAGGVMYAPSYPTSHHSRRHRHRHSYPSYTYGYGGYGQPAIGAPMIMQPSYSGGYGYGHSWGNRIRQFLGFTPSPHQSTWGFMGYPGQRSYFDRRGRPAYRI